MGRLKRWVRTGLEWAKRAPEKVRWATVAVVVLAVVCLLGFDRCDPFAADPPEDPPTIPKVETVPVSVVQRIAENMADTNLGLLDRIRGLEARQPERILITDTLASPPPICAPSIEIADNKLSTPVYEQVTGGWSVKLVEDVDVTGCDGLRIVGDQVICDTPRLGKLSAVFGGAAYTSGLTRSQFTNSELAGFDAYAGLGWQRHRDSRLSVAALYGVDQTIRLRAEWKVNLW